MHSSFRHCQVNHHSACYQMDCSSLESSQLRGDEKCFMKAGILNERFHHKIRSTADPFLDLDDDDDVLVGDKETQDLMD